MKFFFTAFLLTLCSSSCIFNKNITEHNTKEYDTIEIIYTHFSRGFFKEIHIEKSKITTYLIEPIVLYVRILILSLIHI